MSRRISGLVFTFSAVMAGCTIIPGLDLGLDQSRDGAPTEVGGFDLVHVSPQVVAELATKEVPVYGAEDLRPAAELRTSGSAPAVEKYLVGPGDVLSIIVWDHPELTNPTGEFRDPESSGRLVGADGKIFYPYVGELEVAGRSIAEIRRLIASRLARVVREPQVDVRIAAYRSQKVRVTGEVNAPAVLPVTDRPPTALEAIAAAGGLTPEASRRMVVLRREGVEYRLSLPTGAIVPYASDADLVLRDGDVLYVPNSDDQAIFLMGAVGKQASISMPRGTMSLAEALSLVEGLDPSSADRSRVFVIRAQVGLASNTNTPGAEIRPIIYLMNMSDIGALIMAERFSLWPRDVVYVDRTGLATYNAVVSQVLPTVSTLFQLDRLLDSN